jgi:hypothetical protein
LLQHFGATGKVASHVAADSKRHRRGWFTPKMREETSDFLQAIGPDSQPGCEGHKSIIGKEPVDILNDMQGLDD